MYRNGFFKTGSIDQNNKAKFISVSTLRKIQEVQFGNLPVFVPFSIYFKIHTVDIASNFNKLKIILIRITS